MATAKLVQRCAMAIRKRKGRKDAFQVYWRNPFTQKLQSKTVGSKEEAEKLNDFIHYQLKHERDQFRPQELRAEEPEVQTLGSIFYLYLKDRNFTKDNLERCLASAKGFIADYGATEIEKVDKQMLIEMQKSCIKAGNKGSTIQRKMGIIKAVLHWAYRNSFIENMPLFPLAPKSVPARNIPPSQEEIARIYKVAPPHLKRIIILGFMFGLRVGPCEMMKLKWSDIDLSAKVMRVPNAHKGIGDPWREIPVMQELIPLFSEWQEEDRNNGMEYLIHYKGKPVKKIKHCWSSTLAKAGIARYFRPYNLRHGFATEAIASGADYGTVAALMGHKSPVMVLRHYQHVNNQQKVRVMEKLVQPTMVNGLV